MPLYRADRTDNVGWDEHDGLVVRATSEDAARALVTKLADPDRRSEVDLNDWLSGFNVDGSNWELELVPTRGTAEVILSSFNAG
jgi:hypothetical protein